MWSKLQLPFLFERMIGFSLPVDRRVAIVSYEGIHVVNLDRPDEVHHDLNHPQGGTLFDPKSGTLPYHAKIYSILGLYGGKPITRSIHGETLQLRLEEDVLVIRGAQGDILCEHPFEDLSGDWRIATFSKDASHILLGLPYDLHILRRH